MVEWNVVSLSGSFNYTERPVILYGAWFTPFTTDILSEVLKKVNVNLLYRLTVHTFPFTELMALFRDYSGSP